MAADARDLCELADVIRYAPGYDPDTDVNSGALNEILQKLITSESTTQHRRGREFIQIDGGDEPDPRIFDIGSAQVRRRKIRIGDCSAIAEVTIVDEYGTVIATVDEGNWVALPRIRQEWEPIRTLWFPTACPDPVVLSCGWTVSVDATFGFPSIPEDVRQAVAKLVVVRYVDEVAPEGTPFTDALADINLGRLFDAATIVLNDYAEGGLA